MTSIGTSRHASEGVHTRVSVFVGPDRDHRALAGILTFRDGEDNEFIRRVEDQHQPAPPDEERRTNVAALWGSAENGAYSVDDRLQFALSALDLLAKEIPGWEI